ncbi:FtsQ-type POTRA domain-containing protein [Candidatus Parcubacteria bacterium]|nr:MAG: FtsQ-type POTRA domain-containing protein [Candidatus Parcubacteria bacterium]
MSSKGTIDLRRKKPGGHLKTLSFNWGSRPAKSSKNSSLRKRRQRKKMLWAGAAFLFILCALYGVHRLTYLPRLSISNVAIAGTEQVSPDSVKTHVESTILTDTFSFFSKKNIFLYPRTQLEASIREQFPRILSVRVERESLLAQAITVTVQERQAYGRWCRDSSCYLLDEKGYIFADEGASSPSVSARYTFHGALANADTPIGQTFLPDTFSDVAILLGALEKGGFFPQHILMEDGKDFTIQVARGYSIRASLESKPHNIVHNLELILSSDALRGKEGELEYVDLRFGNRVYYKFKGQAEQEQ